MKQPKMITVTVDGDTYHMRRLNAYDHSTYSLDTHDDEENINFVNFSAKLLVRCLCDEQGNRLYKDEDAESFGRSIDFEVSEELFRHAQSLNARRSPDDIRKN